MKTVTQTGMMAKSLTPEQVKADNAREYNAQVWTSNVDRYSRFKDVEFYKVEKGNGFDYDRFFVVYTLPEGLRLLSDFGYSSSLTSCGFQMAFIADCELTEDKNLKFYEAGTVRIYGMKIRFADGNEAWLNNSPEARKYMIERSKKGIVFTKEGI